MYLTGATNVHTRNRGGLRLGVMLQPSSGYVGQVDDYDCHAADNGCFSQGGRFELDSYLTWLDTVPRLRCLFATAPDVYGDAEATLARSLPVLPLIRSLGFQAALVAQNGLTVERTPWERFDCLFLGGKDIHRTPAGKRHNCAAWRCLIWKLSPPAVALAAEARRRGKWVHMGRVNGLGRIRSAQLMQCHSADGTKLAHGPNANWPVVRRWLRSLEQQEPLFLLTEASA